MKNHSFWLQNAMHAGAHTLVDMGSMEDQSVRDATDRLAAMLPKGNIQIVGNGRITVRIPARRITSTLSAFPEIEMGVSYSFCTHRRAAP